tara:strand:- start:2745 stop:3197 length:453 start_codon:yes stop_codon:yes gene_type:complete
MSINNKIFYKIITISFFTIGSSSIIAGETWIEISKSKIPEYITRDKPHMKDHGFVQYLDVKSIVKKNDITYFNWNTRITNPNGTILDSDFEKSKKGGRINCKNKTVYLSGRPGKPYVPITKENITGIVYDFWSNVYPIVCETNKTKWKFW